MIKDSRSILTSAIVKLSIGIGGINLLPVNFKNRLITYFLWIIRNLHRFIVAVRSGFYLFISWIFYMATGIAGYNGIDSMPFVKRFYHTPKTPTSKGGFFHFFHESLTPVR